MFTSLLLLASFLTTLVRSECDQYGQIDPKDWQDQESFSLTSECPGSYFKIDILSNTTETLLNYNLVIDDPSVNLTNAKIAKDLFLASTNAMLVISVRPVDLSAPVSFVNIIKYQEVKKRFDPNYANENQNGSFRQDSFKPNSETHYNLNGFAEVKLLDLSWEMPSNLGYIALDNGNGRMTLFTSPSKSKLKLAVKSKTEKLKWVVKTSKTPNPQENSHFAVDYALGPDEVTTTSTTTTTTSRPPDGEIRIFIVAINERQFYRDKFSLFYDEVAALTNDKGNCTLTRTSVKSCAVTCAMTDDPDRGCLTFALTLKKSTLCLYEESEFRNDLNGKLKTWAHHYGASRINIDDCLTPAQIQWITIAVLIPLASMAFVGISYFTVKNWMKKLAKRRIYRRQELNRIRKSTQSVMTLNKKRMGGARTNSQFEIIEEEF